MLYNANPPKPEAKYKIRNFFCPKTCSNTGPKLHSVNMLKAICSMLPCINICVIICQDLKFGDSGK